MSWLKLPRGRPGAWLPRVGVLLLGVYILHMGGVLLWVREQPLDLQKLQYPMQGEVSRWVDMIEMQQAESVPVPVYQHQYDYRMSWAVRCNQSERLRLVMLVKSDPTHFKRREAIRNSWGFERRFSDVLVRRVFLVGRRGTAVQRRIDSEHATHKDILQADFTDAYFNNTIKSMVGLNWARSCNAEYMLLCDDDMYISLKNLLRFARDPTRYPQWTAFEHVPDLPDAPLLYAGFVFKSRPHRHRTSKWYVPLEEWPYNAWPPYVTAGAVLLSKHALDRMCTAAMFTKHFRFDDVYLALLAHRAGIPAVHSPHFHFWKLPYNVHEYENVIASHGYDDPAELVRVWSEQKSAGHA